MNSLRIHSLMVSNFIFILLLLATGSAFAQRQYEVKPRILIVFDTSGSMARTFSGSSNYGDGSHDNWDGSRECCPGVYNGGGELSRLYAAKNAMSQMLNASGEIEFGLAKFAQDYYSNQNNAVASSYYYGNQTAGDFDELRYHGFTSNYWAEFDGADDVYKWLAVGFGDYASSGGDLLYGRGANTENDRAEVLMWMDHHEYGNGTEQADLSLWDGPDGDGLEQELRADGNTPLGEVLRASRYYLEELRDPVTGKDDYRSCRKYIVVVLTDGAANGAISSTSEVSELYADGIETWVIGLAYSSSTLNTMATNGGMHYDPNNWGSAFTAYSESALATALFYIVSESLVFEECNYIDDDCDFEVDEGVGGQFCDVHNTYLDDATTLEWDTDSAPIWNESGDTDTFSNPNHDYVCDDPGETVCDGIDDNCDGQIDETPNDGAWSANEDPDFGTACTPPDDTDVPSYLSDDPDNIPSPCRAGTWVCIPGGEGKQCINYIGPTVEKCDGIDNDCDGLVDENTDNLADYSIVDTDVTCGSSVGACSEGYLECTAGGWACNDTDGSAEECDGIDNDCDGVTDETFTGQGNDCYEEGDGDATNGCILNVDVWECYGICEVGELICDDTDGTYGTACVGMSTPQPDNTCNGLDDDCDGSIDDDVATGTTACPAGSGAWTVKSVGNPYTLCVAGTLQCCGSDVTGCTMPDDAGDIVCVPNNSEPAIVSPTAEVCDGYDNDCDGEIDENLSTACGGCIDADYPSFDCIDTDPGRGECSVGLISCTASNGSGSASWSSCVGSRGPVEETCNGKDDDCDGAVDEDLNLGSCYPAGLSGCVDTDCVGECAVGTYVCSSGTLSCVGYTAPSLEGTVCDDLDNNCNGQVDEGITNTCGDSLDTETYPGAANGVGICRYGVQYCSEGVTANATDWGSCTGSQGPTAELCNGLDDDCDGAYEDSEAADLAANSEDSLVGASCGACDGVYECVPDTSKTVGQLGAYGLECVGEEPGVEVCNGEDENCNDILDDGIDPVSCGGCVVGVDTEFDCIDTDPSAGECEEGLNYCLDGGWTTDCYGAVGPVSEVCDGLDNDCDGNVDEDFIGMDDVVCQVAVGECPEGIQQCVAVDGVTSLHCCDANVWDASGECVTPEIAQIEECDGRDNDCDGFVDEDLAGTGEPCGQSLGICEPGTYQCILDTDAGDYGIVCIGGSGGTDEVCNNLDDDCDGQVDEDIPLGDVCTKAPNWMSDPVLQSEYPEGIGECPLGNLECVAGEWLCDVPGPTAEVCDGLDNDCDGLIDEDEQVECPVEGSICIEGQCAELCGEGEFTCPVGKECVEQLSGTKICMTSLCDPTRNDALPCVFNEYYCTPDQGFEPPCECDPLAAMCVDVCYGKVCPDGQECVAADNGRCHGETEGCMVTGCGEDEVCVEIEMCTEEPCQECIADPCATVTCEAGQYCNPEGSCVSSCENVECPSGQGCREGLCVEDACAGVKCIAGILCNPVTGQCDATLDNPCKGVSCEFFELCVDGACEFDPCINIDCPNGTECFDGSCYEPMDGSSGTSDADSDTDADNDSDSENDTSGGDGDSENTNTGVDAEDMPDSYKGLDRVIATGTGGCMCSTAPGASPVDWTSWVIVALAAIFTFVRIYRPKRKEVVVKVIQRSSLFLAVLLIVACQVEPYEFSGASGTLSSDSGDTSDSSSNGSDPDGSDVNGSDSNDTSGNGSDTSSDSSVDCSECDANETCCTNVNGVQFCVDLTNNPSHCGACNTECLIPHASAVCNQSNCIVSACETYWYDQNDSIVDGCEHYCQPTVDPSDNGDVCDGIASSANPDNDDYTPVDNDCDFEFDEDVDFQNDPKNCGYCGNLCMFNHAEALCVSAVCTLGDCDERWWNLTGGANDGCEYYCDGDTDSAEICDNKDNNCNGTVDEGNPGGDGECYPTGSAGCTLDTDGSYTCAGICSVGVRNCDNGNLTCTGYQLPEDEVCDGLDNNCNGQIDEGLRISCGGAPGADPNEGICQQGLASCSAVSPSAGVPGEVEYDTESGCVGQVSPGVERCDNLDNDCDGLVDELSSEDDDDNNISENDETRLGLACGFGVCASYVTQCINGRITCEDFTIPETEIPCNGSDDDCDGSVDEVETYQCGGSNSVVCNDTDNGCDDFSEGICQVGMYSCDDSDGCINDVPPQCADTDHCDVCDGLDNDCDGVVDEDAFVGVSDLGCGSACIEGVLECHSGNIECNIPDTDLAASPDLCDPAGEDEDCDTATPNGYGEDDYGQPCDGTDADECEEGIWACTASGMACVETRSYNEICDGIDNDCDDLVDEDDPDFVWGDTDPTSFGCNVCPGETVTQVVCDDANGWRCQYDVTATGIVDCDGAAPCFDLLTVESQCDTRDNDCDGVVDDDFNFTNDLEHCSGCNNACPGTLPPNSPGWECAYVDGGYECVANGCDAGWVDADGVSDTDNGCECEFNTAACGSDPEHPTAGCDVCWNGAERNRDDDCDGIIDEDKLSFEKCNGVDDNCNGTVDLADPGLDTDDAPSVCNAACGGSLYVSCAADTDDTDEDWICVYDTEYVELDGSGVPVAAETRCDGRDNDCDGEVDEDLPMANADLLGDVCDNDDGSPFAYGECIEEGIWACQADNFDAVAVCCSAASGGTCEAVDIIDTPANLAVGKVEVLDGADNDCDGLVDEGADDLVESTTIKYPDPATGPLQFSIFTYEASRQDASDTDPGLISSVACSQSDVLPWTYVNFVEARAACQLLNTETCGDDTDTDGCWDLCTVQQWVYACNAEEISNSNPYYPYGQPYEPYTCNGVDYGASDTDSDTMGVTVRPTAMMDSCIADWTGSGATEILDMSGNVEEWTATANVVGTGDVLYDIRGGSYNDLAAGLACDFNFSAAGGASTKYRLSNLGFRCCRMDMHCSNDNECLENFWCSSGTCVEANTDDHCGDKNTTCGNYERCAGSIKGCQFCSSNAYCGINCTPCDTDEVCQPNDDANPTSSACVAN